MRARFSVSPGHSRPRAPPWACCCSRQPGPVCAAGSTRPLHRRLGGCEWTQVWVLDLDRVLHLPDRRSVGQRRDCWPPWEGWSGVTQAVRPHCSGSPTGASSHLPPSGDITRDPVKMQTQTSRSTWGLRLCISNQSETHPGASGPPGAVFTSFNVRRVPCSAPPPEGCSEARCVTAAGNVESQSTAHASVMCCCRARLGPCRQSPEESERRS